MPAKSILEQKSYYLSYPRYVDGKSKTVNQIFSKIKSETSDEAYLNFANETTTIMDTDSVDAYRKEIYRVVDDGSAS